MKTTRTLAALSLCAALLWGVRPSWAERNKAESAPARSALASVQAGCNTGSAFKTLDVNNVSAGLLNTGGFWWDNQNPRYEVPRGSGKTSIFAGAMWIGGLANGQLRISAARYGNYELWPGPIEAGQNGTCAQYDRIWKVDRKDLEALDEGGAPTPDIRDWPWQLGAPWIDKNGDGRYRIEDGDRPRILGDQMLWMIMNDVGGQHRATDGAPIGLEVRFTAFAFNREGALGNTTFYKIEFVNKGDADLTNAYVSIFHDPDLGNFQDDYIGCDTLLGLGFCYNGDNVDEGAAGYGDRPPAVGTDFFQGPLVNNDGIDNDQDGQVDEADERLKMTSFTYFNNGACNNCDPTTGIQYYNYMQARFRDGSPLTFGGDGTNPASRRTFFAFPSDPNEPCGPNVWHEVCAGNVPADRRFVMTTGPFTLKRGQVQEIVFGTVWAQGLNRLASVTALKSADAKAQAAFDLNFELPSGPPSPRVEVAQLPNQVTLSWDDRAVSYRAGNYRFEGYMIYQYRTPSTTAERKLLATYDVKNDITVVFDEIFDERYGVEVNVPVAFGSDSGLKFSITIDKDAFTGGPLINGKDYYFAVVAYAIDPEGAPGLRMLTSPLSASELITVRPTYVGSFGGLTPRARYGDKAPVVQTTGKSDATIIPTVVNPLKVKDNTYQITFKDAGRDDHGQQILKWSVRNKNTGQVLKSDMPLSPDPVALVDEGIELVVDGPPPGVKREDMFSTEDESKWGWKIISGTRRFTWAGGENEEFEGFQHALTGLWDPYSYFGSGPRAVSPTQLRDVELRLARTDVNGNVLDPNDPNWSRGYRYLRLATAAPARPEFAPYIINRSGGYAFQIFEKNVPLSAWDVTDPNNPRRLAVGFLENNTSGGLVDGKYWPGPTNTDNWASSGPREWLFIFTKPYSETQDPELAGNILTQPLPVMYWASWNRRGNVAFSPNQSGEDRFGIYPNKVISPTDVYEFSLASLAPVKSDSALKASLDQIRAVPNPYYGASAYEIRNVTDVIRFTNLPERAVLRIFTVAGTLVRTLIKDNPNSTTLDWDLQNEQGLPVASGMYIVHVEFPDYPQEKPRILKVAILKKTLQLSDF